MATNITIDASDLQKGLARLGGIFGDVNRRGVNAIADELLRLSQIEVPHDVGTLQNTGHVEPEEEGAIVGYNTVYAARLHENPQYKFQKGRKGKYLEDPLKMNLRIFLQIYKEILEGAL